MKWGQHVEVMKTRWGHNRDVIGLTWGKYGKEVETRFGCLLKLCVVKCIDVSCACAVAISPPSWSVILMLMLGGPTREEEV